MTKQDKRGRFWMCVCVCVCVFMLDGKTSNSLSFSLSHTHAHTWGAKAVITPISWMASSLAGHTKIILTVLLLLLRRKKWFRIPPSPSQHVIFSMIFVRIILKLTHKDTKLGCSELCVTGAGKSESQSKQSPRVISSKNLKKPVPEVLKIPN